MHGALSTGPKTPEGRARIAEANRQRARARRIAKGLPPDPPLKGKRGFMEWRKVPVKSGYGPRWLRGRLVRVK